ncbi:hypothetical protein CO058_03330 [candidate division WWE3 bacterium CG_4_9_14_0_2_um_filter_35_11]|uniref:Uncharacterized protein n=1 Tax=candidate division WWE3 bacterium CG_4_9_14_0_2_um_filter_35_11 TaxID=1975077 RepID=A0A2M8EL29_UNCKA|nr:MAG: hypothetical protein COV25_00725 [candidate division WWE3 bacterium CG10_big_fil_rev_8_21_14_0_10_35_32]PJC23439.1 MAG: hypothetical protein CO058_03330 [candidate division WWE3 bacterium CG_4_9_14_0_2_um_filter_35_11]
MELNKDLRNKSQPANNKLKENTVNKEKIKYQEILQLKTLFRSEINNLWKYLQNKEQLKVQR